MKLHHGKKITPFGIKGKTPYRPVGQKYALAAGCWLLAAEAKEFYYKYENLYN